MNKIILLAILFLGVIFGQAQEYLIQINGSTNVNEFKCKNNEFYFEDEHYNFLNKQLPDIILKSREFDCGNNIMTKDFQKTLQSQTYPNLHIKFLNFSKKESNKYSAVVEVKMMNKTVKYNIEFAIMNGRLIGKETVKFSDFGIVPPKKMGGMIVVKDNLDLVFNMASKK